MLITILIILAVIIVILFIVAALRPPEFQVERSATIAASPAIVFDQVNDLKKYQAWNPWSRLEPTAEHTFSGPPAGVGASLAWAGKKIGAGRLTIAESRPGELIKMRLEFIKPFAANHTAEFTLRAEGGQTLISWSMSGVNNCMFRVMGLFFNMDKVVGKQFEDGLANLRALAEAAARK